MSQPILHIPLSASACLFLLCGMAWDACGQDVASMAGRYRRHPVENGFHSGTLTVVTNAGTRKLRWLNQAGASWDLTPNLKQGVLTTGRGNPYLNSGRPGSKEFRLIIRNDRVVAFEFMEGTYVRDGERLLSQKSGGLLGHIAMTVESPPPDFGNGVSFYRTIWPIVETPLARFQIGLGSTWIVPDNRDFNQPCCPPGTTANQWAERAPNRYRDVFQTIEGGAGFWVNSQFPLARPKYRMNGTPSCYDYEVSSPGWGFGKTQALPSAQMGIAQISNRLIVPPDGLTFGSDADGHILGNAWVVLPLKPATRRGVPTGDQSWTLFFNAANFKGPVAFWIPDTWSRLSGNHKELEGRGLDARPGLMKNGGMEVNTIPMFEATDETGTVYSKIPRMQFPVDNRGETRIIRDITYYKAGAVQASGKFDLRKSWNPKLRANPIRSLKQSGQTIRGIDNVVATKIYGSRRAQTFGLKWKSARGKGVLPQYFKQVGNERVAITSAQVPAETGLREQTFQTARSLAPYESPSAGVWVNPGPRGTPVQVKLNDGSVVTYAWYRFIDQPSIQAFNWSDEEKARMQEVVERIHSSWPINRNYIPNPTSGSLVDFDSALLVTPPTGLEVGFVPVVLSQRAQDE